MAAPSSISPGHRRATAAELAVMVIDAARHMDVPIMTFVNKMDREDIARTSRRDFRPASARCAPMTWPAGMSNFKGVLSSDEWPCRSTIRTPMPRRPHFPKIPRLKGSPTWRGGLPVGAVALARGASRPYCSARRSVRVKELDRGARPPAGRERPHQGERESVGLRVQGTGNMIDRVSSVRASSGAA